MERLPGSHTLKRYQHQDQPRLPHRVPEHDPGHHPPAHDRAARRDGNRAGHDPDRGARLPHLHPVEEQA